MTKRDEKHTERLAYHEAGHALVAKRLGYTIINCTIERNGSTGPEGETTIIHPNANIFTYVLGLLGIRGEENDRDQIAYLMAGIEAVRLAGCEKTISIEGAELSDDIIESRRDILEAIGISKRLGHGDKLSQDIEYVMGKSKATEILEANTDALNAIAMALIEIKTLSGVEIAKIIESHPPSNTQYS